MNLFLLVVEPQKVWVNHFFSAIFPLVKKVFFLNDLEGLTPHPLSGSTAKNTVFSMEVSFCLKKKIQSEERSTFPLLAPTLKA